MTRRKGGVLGGAGDLGRYLLCPVVNPQVKYKYLEMYLSKVLE